MITHANVHVLPQTTSLRALHSVVRDRSADPVDFVRCSRRIIRMLLESALGLLPHEEHDVLTPIGETYAGARFTGQLCGVSVVRAGESMEGELREILPGVPVGKILIQRDKVTKLPKLYYSHLPPDVADRHVLLLEPMLATGGSALAAVKVLLDAGVREDRIVFVSFLSSPPGLATLRAAHPDLLVVTSSIERALNDQAFMIPGIGDFGDRFFGTVPPRAA